MLKHKSIRSVELDSKIDLKSMKSVKKNLEFVNLSLSIIELFLVNLSHVVQLYFYIYLM